MDEFNHFCDNWNQLKSNICHQSFQQQEDMYSNRNEVKIPILKEPDKTEEIIPTVKSLKKQNNNKESQTSKRTRTTPEERKLVMNVYKNLLAGRCVETFGSGSVKRTSELTGLPLRSVYRIRNEELIACGSIEFVNTTADEEELEEDTKHDGTTEGTDKPSKNKTTRQKRLSLIKKKIIFHVFDTLRSEQPDSSDSAVINITSEITGCPVRTIHRIRVEEKSEQGLQGPKVAKAKDTKKYKLSFKKYGDDIRLAIRSTIYDVQARTEFPIIKEIHDAVNERLNLSLSRSTLMRLIKHLGFFFVRKEGKKHILIEKSRDSNKKSKKQKLKSNPGGTSKLKVGDKKIKTTNERVLPSDGFGNMFTNIPQDYSYLDMNKQYDLMSTGQYQPPALVPHPQSIEVSSTSTHTNSLKCSSSGPKPKRVLAKLNSEEVRAAIRAVIYDLKVKSITPTISEIQLNVKNRFNMNLARTTLHRHIKRAGFVFKKKEGNKHILVEKPAKKVKKPRKPRIPKDPNASMVAKKVIKILKTKEDVQRPAQSTDFIRISSELDSIVYDASPPQYGSHEHKLDYMSLDNKQYNPLGQVTQVQQQDMIAQTQQRHQVHVQQQPNEFLRQMPTPLQPISILQRDVDVSHNRKLMTLSTAKNCGIQWT